MFWSLLGFQDRIARKLSVVETSLKLSVIQNNLKKNDLKKIFGN